MNDIKYLDNVFYNFNKKKFIINNDNNLHNYLHNYIVINPFHSCYSHFIMDGVFPLFWILKDIKYKYKINGNFNLFIRLGNNFQYYKLLKNNNYFGVHRQFLDNLNINNIIFEKDINKNLHFKNLFEIKYFDEWISHWQRGVWNSKKYYPQRNYEISNVVYNDNVIYKNLKEFVLDTKNKLSIESYTTKNNLVIIDRKNDRLFDTNILDKIIKIIPQKINFNGIKILEDMNLNEQIKLFSQNNIFIFRHGSCLINLLWIQDNSIVIDLDHQSNRPNIVKRICKLTNSNHHYLNYFNIDYKIISNILK